MIIKFNVMIYNLLNVLLMAPPKEGQSPYSTLIFFVLIIVVFYFFMIRPQTKRQKELKNYRNSLQKGDKVITTGGIYGKVNAVTDTTVSVEIAEKLVIKVDKNAILKDSSDVEAQK
jgi:preprotein translocase subunit YajC